VLLFKTSYQLITILKGHPVSDNNLS